MIMASKKKQCERKGGSWVSAHERDGKQVEPHCRGADV